jgi:NhaA family Na+:H+ antiporter
LADPSPDPIIPVAPIDRVAGPLARFMHVEAAGGVVLLGATFVAVAVANSPLADTFEAFWKILFQIGIGDFVVKHSLRHWVNDGLMAVFFFVVGLEVKRELAVGELRDPQRAALPAVAAIGGMVVPAAIFLAMTTGTAAARGWGIPMATDIAFVVGCLALLGSRCPPGLRVLLLSLAIVDDLGAILVIAIGYTDQIGWGWVASGVAGIAVVSLLARLGVRSFFVYGVLGLFIWESCHESGIHATIAGVVLGMMTPATPYLAGTAMGQRLEQIGRSLSGTASPEDPRGLLQKGAQGIRDLQWAARETISPLAYLENLLHPWVAFFVMPVFALANAGVPFDVGALGSTVALAVGAGLVVGKPLGVLLFSFVAVKVGLARLPDGVDWRVITAGGFLAGIGFTMSLFISGLALPVEELADAKVGVLVASVIAAVCGMLMLLRVLPKSDDTD